MIALSLAMAAAASGQSVEDVATCVARHAPREAHAVLTAPSGVGTGALDAALDRCGASAAMPQPVLIGAVAEAMMQVHHRGERFAGRFRKTAADGRTMELMRRGTEGWPAIDAAATCVVRFAPEKSEKLIRTAAGSAAEGRAIQTIAEPLRNCVDAGAPFSVGRAELRAGVARAFYRVYVAATTDYGI